jgi:hypothetical protein
MTLYRLMGYVASSDEIQEVRFQPSSTFEKTVND